MAEEIVVKRGPMFDGRARLEMREMTRAIGDHVSTVGRDMVQTNLHAVLKHPTGYYESRISKSAHGNDWLINDSGVIYGPWLEGVGSRNFPVTRFKGYATFRRTYQELVRRLPEIVAPIVERYVRRMQ